jgi:hypothetical protein
MTARAAASQALKDARTLAREHPAMVDESSRIAFNGAPMQRAKLRGVERNVAAVLAGRVPLPGLRNEIARAPAP